MRANSERCQQGISFNESFRHRRKDGAYQFALTFKEWTVVTHVRNTVSTQGCIKIVEPNWCTSPMQRPGIPHVLHLPSRSDFGQIHLRKSSEAGNRKTRD